MSRRFLLLTLFFAVFIFALSLAPAQSDTIIVNSSCSLANAITSANSDRATGGCSAGRGADIIELSDNITLSTALPRITSAITIEGDFKTISGNSSVQLFHVVSGGVLKIRDLSLANGKAATAGAVINGGTLSISNSILKNNAASNGGAIANSGTLSISRSSFIGNSATQQGGAIFTGGSGTRTTIVSSTFSGNRASVRGGAVVNSSGGNLSVTNSTFYKNASLSGGGLHNSGTLNLVNSIIAGSSGGDCIGTLARNIKNLIQDGSCSPALRGAPKLGALAPNWPRYYPLLAGSLGISDGDENHCPDVDQSGRGKSDDEACNIGSVDNPVTGGPTPAVPAGVTARPAETVVKPSNTPFIDDGETNVRPEPSDTPTDTPTATDTPGDEDDLIIDPVPSDTPTSTPTDTPTSTPTDTPTNTPIPPSATAAPPAEPRNLPAPSNFRAPNNHTVSWDTLTGATQYRLRRDWGDGQRETLTLDKSATSHAYSDLQVGVRYSVYVRALGDGLYYKDRGKWTDPSPSISHRRPPIRPCPFRLAPRPANRAKPHNRASMSPLPGMP